MFKWIKQKLRGLETADQEKKAESMESTRNLGGTFTEHQMDVSQLGKMYPNSNVNPSLPDRSTGLSAKDAQVRFELDGPNILTPPKEISNLKLLLKQFLNVFWLLQIAAGILSLITYIVDPSVMYNLWIAILLFGIVIIMCVVQFFEEKKALAVIKAFSQLLPVKCTVIRGGQTLTLEADQIVVGDIVAIKTGSRVPADLRLIHTVDLKLETSSITGESEPIEFTSDKAGEGVTVFDSCNVAFNGSFCVEGEGYGIAIRTAERTIIGQIASLTTDQSTGKSTLDIEVHRFVKLVTVAAIIVGITVFLIGGFIQHWKNVSNLFMNGFLVAIISTVPQGLPTTVSSELTIIAHRMAKKNGYHTL
uniref:Cation_ATPase_N domain-containing protein n=1 Tax=Steinernema glaseri TaxID=37863 RepID=A0A1I7Z2M4_9BILA